MTLKEYINTLNEQKQFNLALELTERTLPIWNEYAKSNKLEYIDTVVGMHHKVDQELLIRTIQTVRNELETPKSQGRQISQLQKEFSDPIVAMQDLDWELPYSVEKTFYAIRNLLEKLCGQETTVFDEPQIYVVINQAIDALSESRLMSDDEIKEILNKYKTVH